MMPRKTLCAAYALAAVGAARVANDASYDSPGLPTTGAEDPEGLMSSLDSGLVETNQSWFWSTAPTDRPLGGTHPTWERWRPTIVAVADRSDYPRVAGVYTFGAPSTAKTPLTDDNRADGCFQGYRTFSGNHTASDPVAWLASAGNFKHARMNAMRLLQDQEPTMWACSDDTALVPGRDFSLDLALHFTTGYLRTVKARLPEVPKHLEEYTTLMRSVYVDRDEASTLAAGVGYRLVAEADHDADMTRLFQRPDTLDCVISFRGSDNAADWVNNIGIGSRDFCNFAEVHSGFVEKFTNTVTSQQFQINVRANFPKCASLTATGHSLGGAVAEMFAACANRGPQGLTPLVDLPRGTGLTVAHAGWMTYMAYLGQITWNHGTPELMPHLS